MAIQWAPYILTPTNHHCSDFDSTVIATNPLRILYLFSLDRVLRLYEEVFDGVTLYLIAPPEYPDNRFQELNVNCKFMWYRIPGTELDRLRVTATWENPADKGKWPGRYKDLIYTRPTQFPLWSFP